MLVVLGGLGGCTAGAAPPAEERADAGHPAGLGARPEAFGIAGGPAADGRSSSSGLEVSWETIGTDPAVVAVAELWDPAARQAVTADGLTSTVDRYARRFGGPDAELVTRTLLGGVDVFQYRAASLRPFFRSSPDPAARAGLFLVAVTLAPDGPPSRERAIAADPADPRRIPPGTFSIAVLAGNPWP